MNILVTGGTGLVGKAIQRVLNEINDTQIKNCVFLSSKHCDLRDYNQTYTYFSKRSPDIVIHLAACVGGLYKNINQRRNMFEDNFLINFHVLKICYELNVSKVISCLSTCVFPDHIENYPITENDLHQGEPHSSNYPYAYAKRFVEIQSRIYNELGRNFTCLIPTNLYGIHDNFSLSDGHVIPSLIHKIYLSKLHNHNSTSLLGNGTALRQFLYVDDFARIILHILPYKNPDTIIVTPNIKEEISIREVAKIISDSIQFKGNIVTESNYDDGQFKKTASNERLRTYLPLYRFTPLHQGIDITVKWFLSQYPDLRK